MPYFHVSVSQTKNIEFVVNAPNQETAEDIASAAAATEKCDNKKIVHLNSSKNFAISSSTTTKSAWLETLKEQKASK